MTEKLYLSAQQLLEDSFKLGAVVIKDGFRPNRILAIWRGGVPMGVAVQELMAWYGIETDHIAIRTASYSGIDGRSVDIRIHGLDYLINHCDQSDRLLIVDDVFDTGHTVAALIHEIERRARRNTPSDIRVAVPYYKPARNQTDRKPDYYLHETEAWLKYPHSLEGLSVEEIKQHRPNLFELISPCLSGIQGNQ